MSWNYIIKMHNLKLSPFDIKNGELVGVLSSDLRPPDGSLEGCSRNIIKMSSPLSSPNSSHFDRSFKN